MNSLKVKSLWVIYWLRKWEENFDYFLQKWLTLATKEEKETYWPAILEYFKLNKTAQYVSLDFEEKEAKELLKWHLQYNYWIFMEWINFEIFNMKEYEKYWKALMTYKISEKSSFKIWGIWNPMTDIFINKFNNQ